MFSTKAEFKHGNFSFNDSEVCRLNALQQIKSSKNASKPDISSGFGTLSATFSALK
jgi:hypothetical protein